MTSACIVSVDALFSKVKKIFEACGVHPESATAVARVIVAAERDDCKSHGIYRIEGCLRGIASGKVAPGVTPRVHDAGKAIIEVDAQGGFSNPAFFAGKQLLIERARTLGLAAMVIHDCLHFSALWQDVEALAEANLASLSMCPSYACVAPAGGKDALLGTNPLAFGWPRPGDFPYVFDFATSVVARGEIELHLRAGEQIPESWAIDKNGKATTDPQAALDGAMLTFGAHKGSAISTMIELLAGAMLGEFMSQEALDYMGDPSYLPRHGALILAFDPITFSTRSRRNPVIEGEKLLLAICGQGARLPSQRRFEARKKALINGIELTEVEMAQLERFELLGLETFSA